MTTTDDIRALVEQGKRLLAGERESDPEPDPIIRQFNKRRLAPASRLRQLYAEKQRVEAAARDNETKIADAHMRLQRQQYAYQAAIEDLSFGPGVPDDARLDALADMKLRAVECNALIDHWNGRMAGYQLKVEDAGREFENVYGGWIRAVWARYGPQGGLPQSDFGMVESGTDASGWRAPDPPTRAQLDAILAQIEA